MHNVVLMTAFCMVIGLKTAKMHREVEMADADECEVDERNDGPLNRADVAWSLLAIPWFIAKGFMVAIENIQAGLQNTSNAIDRRKRFAAEAGAAIESMTRGEG